MKQNLFSALEVALWLGFLGPGNLVATIAVVGQYADLGRSTPDSVPNCRRTDFQRESFKVFPMRNLTGEFELTVVAVTHPEGLQTTRGELTLRRNATTDSTRRIQYPVNGSSTIDLIQLGPVTLAYSPATSDTARPGVQIVYNQSQGSIVIAFGNALSSKVVTRDAGVYFDVAQVNDSAFGGTWRSGGRNPRVPYGFFCARRTQTMR